MPCIMPGTWLVIVLTTDAVFTNGVHGCSRSVLNSGSSSSPADPSVGPCRVKVKLSRRPYDFVIPQGLLLPAVRKSCKTLQKFCKNFLAKIVEKPLVL